MKADVVCVSGVDLLMDYLEDVLPASERAALDAHLAACPKCVAFVKAYRETPRILREATAAAMPAALRASLRSFLAAHRTR